MITAGPISLDRDARQAFVDGDLLLLTDGEFDVLRELARDPHTPTPKRDLRHRATPGRSENYFNSRLVGIRAKLARVGVPGTVVVDRDGLSLFEREPAGTRS